MRNKKNEKVKPESESKKIYKLYQQLGFQLFPLRNLNDCQFSFIYFRNFTFPFPSKVCVHVEYHSGTFQHIQNGALRQEFSTVFQ